MKSALSMAQHSFLQVVCANQNLLQMLQHVVLQKVSWVFITDIVKRQAVRAKGPKGQRLWRFVSDLLTFWPSFKYLLQRSQRGVIFQRLSDSSRSFRTDIVKRQPLRSEKMWWRNVSDTHDSETHYLLSNTYIRWVSAVFVSRVWAIAFAPSSPTLVHCKLYVPNSKVSSEKSDNLLPKSKTYSRQVSAVFLFFSSARAIAIAPSVPILSRHTLCIQINKYEVLLTFRKSMRKKNVPQHFNYSILFQNAGNRFRSFGANVSLTQTGCNRKSK